MKCNVGGADRAVRIVVGILALIAAVLGGFGSVATAILYLVAVIGLVTGLVRMCPLYLVFGISSCKTDK